MQQAIQKAGVIGAGVMGATIAAQLANVGIETLLLDIVPPKGPTEEDLANGITADSPKFRNRLAQAGVDTALKSKPASFYLADNKELITVGNLEDDLAKLGEVDWIIEVVVERLDIKQSVFEKIETILKPGIIVSSNTSGISAAAMCEGRSELFRQQFAITHFFNPPRYLKLLEIVPGPDTLPEVLDSLAETCEKRVGKGIIYVKDTPNFVANRLGVFGMYSTIRAMMDLGMSVETVDKLTGPIIGHPKSATFRTADLVGLDTLVHVANNVYDGVPEDDQREMFATPELITKMIDKQLLGQKTKQGFYKKSKDEQGKRVFLSIDYNTLEYTPKEKVKLASLATAKSMSGPERIKALFYADDLAGQFTFRTTTEGLIYTAKRLGDIADDILTIDNALKWGYFWKSGPFETWDALGLAKSTAKMKEAGYTIPAWVEELLASGKESFYKTVKGALHYYDLDTKDYRPAPTKPGVILLPSLKEQEKKIAGNAGASLVDIGDGVACLEFHSKMNSIGEDTIRMMHQAGQIVSKDFDGLVIANHGTNFSVGANLAMVLFAAQEEEWEELEFAVKALQDVLMFLKYLDKPVVAAPAGLTLGGGAEICMAADRVRFAAETYFGLIEVGVGVIPAGGGTKELLIRNTEHLFKVKKGGLYPKQIDMTPFLARAFETIAMAKVAVSGPEAIAHGYLRSTDRMTVNRDYQIEDAKRTVQAMNLEGYHPGRPRTNIRLAGENTLALMKLGLWSLHKAGYILDHDLTVSTKVAHVLCGGNVLEGTEVDEQYVLDLEREAFMSLCGEPKTQARMQHMLEKSKPLRN